MFHISKIITIRGKIWKKKFTLHIHVMSESGNVQKCNSSIYIHMFSVNRDLCVKNKNVSLCYYVLRLAWLCIEIHFMDSEFE
jgi:hypothetical protein